jgi:hypothetical protein
VSCSCDNCECERLREQNMALMAENAELSAHISVLVSLDEKRRETEKQIDRLLVEARSYARKEKA